MEIEEKLAHKKIKINDNHIKLLSEIGNIAVFDEQIYISFPDNWYMKYKNNIYKLDFEDLPLDILRDMKYVYSRNLDTINKILN